MKTEGCFSLVVRLIMIMFLVISVMSILSRLDTLAEKAESIEHRAREQVFLQREYNQLLYKLINDN